MGLSVPKAPGFRYRKPLELVGAGPRGMSWLDLPADTPFGPANLPLGVYSTPGTAPRTGVAIGDLVLDLAAEPAR